MEAVLNYCSITNIRLRALKKNEKRKTKKEKIRDNSLPAEHMPKFSGTYRLLPSLTSFLRLVESNLHPRTLFAGAALPTGGTVPTGHTSFRLKQYPQHLESRIERFAV